MPADDRAALVDDLAVDARKALPLEEPPVVVSREEARLLALRACRRGEPCARRLGARLLLRLLAQREPDALEHAGIERREHVRLILRRVASTCDEKPAVPLHDSRVVAGPQRLGSRAASECEERVEAERAVAARARVRRVAGRVAGDERVDDRLPELLAQVERDVRHAERMAGGARGRDRFRGAARTLGGRAVRVLPQTERDADGVRRRAQQRDRAVHASAHRHGCASGPRGRAKDLAERCRERLDGERLAADGGRLEQRQAVERPLEAVRVGGRDPLSVDAQSNGGPLAAPRGIAR